MSLFPANQITESFTEAFNQALALLEEDKLAEGERVARALLREPALPCYHRIRTLCLLGNIVDDLNEAWRFHQDAKLLWYPLRRSQPQGQDRDIDKYMEELRTAVTELQELLDEEMFPDVEEEDEDMDPDEEEEDEDMDPGEEAEDEADAKLANTDAQAQETED